MSSGRQVSEPMRPRREYFPVVAIVVTFVVVGTLVVIQFGRPEQRWAEVIQALAPNESALRLDLVIGGCDSSLARPTPRVVETSSEVRISVDVRVKSSGDTDLCATGATVTLRSPLGTRRVFDGHSGHQATVLFTDPGATAPGP